MHKQPIYRMSFGLNDLLLVALAAAILVSLAEGWVAYTPEGRYKLGGETTQMFWHSVGLCRFEPGELDRYLDEPLRVPEGQAFF